MLKQRFFKSVTLCIVMLLLLSSIIRAQERRGPETVTFNFEDCPVIGELTEVRFGGSDKVDIFRDFSPHVKFESPEWVKGRDEQYPVGIKAGTAATVKAVFQLTCEKIIQNQNTKVYAKGINAKGFQLASKELIRNGVLATYDFQALSAAFAAGTVDFFDPFEITWYISTDEKNWTEAGESENRLYVPLSKTIKGCNIADGETRVFYSSLHYACEPADGLTDLDKIAEAIYNRFKTRHVPRIDNPTLAGIDGMKYWGAINPLKNGCRGLAGLLNYEDAACGEWRRFLQHCFAQHDIQGCWGYIEAKTPPSLIQNQWYNDFDKTFKTNPLNSSPEAVFLVKSWNIPKLNKFYVVSIKWPYTSIQNSFKASNGTLIEVGDKAGDLAQNMIDPEPFFTNHGTVCLNNQIYDPSYGTGPYGSILEWEIASVDAYAIHSRIKNSKFEDVHIVYPYEFEKDVDNQVNFQCKK